MKGVTDGDYMDWTIVVVASAIVVILTAVTLMWDFTHRVSKAFDEKTRKIMREEFKENNVIQNKSFDLRLEHQNKMLLKDINTLDSRINNYVIEQNKESCQRNAIDALTAHALIESYKRDIKKIYFKLRETGYITDIDKSYIDKIYPLYKDLGGNSDMHQKVGEINDVYSTVIHEAYENKRKKKIAAHKGAVINEAGKMVINDDIQNKKEK